MINELTQFRTAIHTATPAVPDALIAATTDQVAVRNQLYTVVDSTSSDSANYTDNNAILRGVQSSGTLPTADQARTLIGEFMDDVVGSVNAGSLYNEAEVLPRYSNLTANVLANLNNPVRLDNLTSTNSVGTLGAANTAVSLASAGGTAAAADAVSATSFPQFVDFPNSNGLNLSSAVLPALPAASAFWTAATTAQYANYTNSANWTPETATGSKGAYTLKAKTADGASITIQENTVNSKTGDAESAFNGNGALVEAVTFTQGNTRLNVVSSTVSSNISDAESTGLRETEFGSNADALTHERAVAFTSNGINSLYKLKTAHTFAESGAVQTSADQPTQTWGDKVEESYVYSDAALKINSALTHELKASTRFVDGAESLVSTDSANYSYTIGNVKLVYAAAQQKIAYTTGATTTVATTVSLNNFAYVSPRAADRNLTITDTSGVAIHKQAFNDNAATLNVANAAALTPTSDIWTASVGAAATKLTFNTDDFGMKSVRFGRTVDDLLNATNALIRNGENAITSNTAAKNAFGDPMAVKAAALQATFVINGADVNKDGAPDFYTLNGTDGNDTIALKETTPVVLNNNANGGVGNDVITGNTANNVLNGGLGNDTLNGGLGVDALNGNEGADVLNGGAGNDALNGGTGNDILNGNEDDDALNGDAGNDTLNGGTGKDVLNGGANNDTLNGDDGDDALNGNAGNDTLSGGLGDDALKGDAGNDVLNGNDGNDNLDGGAGNDALNGNAGNDVLTGAGGVDTLNGGDGDDVITGGVQGDYSTGGAGNDTFVISQGVLDKVEVKSATGTAILRNAANTADVTFGSLKFSDMTGGSPAATLNTSKFDEISDFGAGDKIEFRTTTAGTNVVTVDANLDDGIANNSVGFLRGSYDAKAQSFVSNATGNDVLAVADNDAGAGVSYDAVVIVGGATHVSAAATAGAFTFA